MKYLLVLVAALGLVNPKINAQEADIVDTAVAAGDFTLLVAAVQSAGLVDALKGPGPLTVFAPTDAAFAALGQDVLDDLLDESNRETLTNILLYHVLEGQVLAEDIIDNNITEATALQGDAIDIAVTDSGVVLNGDSNVVGVNVLASNGVIHVIDKVLLPPTDNGGEELDIVDTAVSAGFNTLVAAVQAAGLEAALRGDGPLTVFAPTDEAFAKLPEETLAALLADPEALSEILLYHVVDGAVTADVVVTLDSAVTLQGESVSIAVDEQGVLLNGNSRVLQTDVLASNGVIHVIDTVLLPPVDEPEPDPSIVDIAVSTPRFSTLVAALQAAGLVEALQGAGPFTVFAPNDDAFAKLPTDTLNALLADPEALADILLYHVVSGAFTANDVLSRSRLATLQGQFADISANDAGAFINDAQIINTDILGSNGVIHEIDTVIIPPDVVGSTYEVTITNLTKGQVFSPPVVVSHNAFVNLFVPGEEATPGLAELAEDGLTGPILDRAANVDGVYQVTTAAGPVPPGQSVTLTIKAFRQFRYISTLGMLVQTNDTFFAAEVRAPADRFTLPKRDASEQDRFGQSVGYATAWDAGTEYNSESCDHIPGPPCGNPFSSPDQEGEGFVFIANGVHGKGDLDASRYDFNETVALIKVRRVD